MNFCIISNYYRGRLRPNIRPLRPGLRLNLGGKGSSTTAIPVPPPTTQASVAESSSDEVEEKVSASKIFFKLNFQIFNNYIILYLLGSSTRD